MNKQNWIEKSHDSWSVFKIMGELVEGYEKLSELGPCVSIFGSARTQEDDPFYKQTVKIAKKIVGMGLGVITGGGPGIMEAANQGAAEAKGSAVGLSISLPYEKNGNQWISDDLEIHFHYFFMRKFWFLYLAKAMVVWPGGFGTLDELMEALTLIQTQKLRKKIPIVLFDEEYWTNIVNWDYMIEKGVIAKSDINYFKFCNSVDEAYKYLTEKITSTHLKGPNF